MSNPSPSVTAADYVAATRAAWRGQLELGALFDTANALVAQGESGLAATLYLAWLKRHQGSQAPLVHFNLGVLLTNEGDHAGAREAYVQALQQAPAFAQARFNLGLIQERMGQRDAAVGEWRWLDSHLSADKPAERPLLLLALNNLGRHHETARRYDEAEACLTRSLRIEPNQPDVLHHWVFLRERQCRWPIYSSLPGVGIDAMRESTSILAMLSLSDDPAAQLAAARHYVDVKIAKNLPALAERRRYGHPRIRVGYCSGDFCRHPVAMLTAELFELHDRSRFETFGFCWTKDDGSPLRRRVINAFEHFVRIDAMDDAAAARLIREHEIDILVDLQGQTLGARPNMLAHRPAPIQITYLGLPATTALPCIDYVIADRFLIPEVLRPFYTETPLYMPDVYMVSDRRRTHSAAPTRASCGLPEGAFVFCSLNNNFKFTPEMFAVWMNILRRTPGSVLWLLADNPWAQESLRRQALAAGIDESRLVFAPRAAPENYLAQYLVADLFLDTFPFNAGTTANDALWMGLPVLTRAGRSFASRMAGALLTAAGLPELIAFDAAGYEDKAVALAQAPAECARIRTHLRDVREHGVLFDTPRFVGHLEAHFEQLVGAL